MNRNIRKIKYDGSSAYVASSYLTKGKTCRRR